ncbi:phosphoribosyl-AMP cyclohydrolase [Desulfurobacterium pacificum]|uniref:Phosphoribosyl-AMP cyclohydrolase n=1 Tax=Desulfurobacterium pacificum TaxID=240166 RepID=A0ABY1N6P6_9BACT|nr:phosphoribosyl-AMP cyclohydrolase [Desulfurobacterium pacificum]SMP01903.1 phosphoribosyl-AMP cyclohydrolase [Desulfurobacterium pacificum]
MVNRELLEKIDFEKGGGLVPVVVQDINTKTVLMLAYANKEALIKTIETGYAHYYSRSRKKIWKKGETSGNVQKVVRIFLDCDEDTLLYLVEQKGVACHTGEYSCFFRTIAEFEDE